VGLPEQSWLAELYRENRRPLFLTAWNILRCSALAEDAVHSAFVRLARMRRPPRDPKLYAFRAVRNAAVDVAKMRGRRREEPFVIDLPPENPLPDLVDAEALAAISAALEELDDDAREVVELHLQAGLTHQETAKLLGEPLPTVASRYRRALEKLRRMLELSNERP
jgi:RNA polymerase sigma-70 factor (ECF subfamily)